MKSLLSVQLVSCASIFWDSFCFVFVFFLFGCFCFFGVLLRSVFCFVYLPHLGLLFLRWCVVVLVFQLHVLAACFCVWVLVLSFFGLTLLGGRSGRDNREGSIYFSAFLIIGLFGRKQALSPRARVFANGFGFEIGHGRGKKMKRFQIWRAKRYKNKGFRNVSWRQKVRQPYSRNALLQLSFCDLKIVWYSVWGGAQNTHEIVAKRL